MLSSRMKRVPASTDGLNSMPQPLATLRRVLELAAICLNCQLECTIFKFTNLVTLDKDADQPVTNSPPQDGLDNK